MRSIAKWTRVALIALSSCALGTGEMAKADAAAGGSIPPGWVWQGVWQDGRWNGQWIPGPGVPPGAPTQGMYPPPPGMAPWSGDSEAMRPETMHMADRCREHHRDGRMAGAAMEHHSRHMRDHDCEGFSHDHPDFAQLPYGPAPYGPAPLQYTPMAYAPVAYMMVPVMTPAQQPCVETRTVTTTTYITEKHRRVIWTKPAPHRKEKRVYTGS